MDNMFEREYWEQKHREAYPEQYAAPPYLGGGPVNAPMMPPQMMPNAPMPPVQSPPPRHWLGSEGIGNMKIGDSLPIPRDFAPTQLPEMGGMRGGGPITERDLRNRQQQLPQLMPQMKGPQTLGDMYRMAPQMKGPQIWAPLERPQLTPEEMMRLQQMLLEQRSRGLLGE